MFGLADIRYRPVHNDALQSIAMTKRSIVKKLILASSLVGILLMPMTVLAHGGVQHNTDDAVIALYQTPLSPVVREYVETDFIFSDKAGARLKNMSVKLTLTDNYTGNEAKDKVVLVQNTKTDANGILRFAYRYPKPDFYDIDLDFTVNDKPQEGGFLLQIRNPYKNWYSLTYIFVLLIGLGGGWFFSQRKMKQTANKI